MAIYEPGDVPSMTWFTSTAASFINRTFLSLVVFDKDAMILTGGAFTLRQGFDTEFGIRVGLVGELWFAYGWYGLPIATIMGGIVGFLSDYVVQSKRRIAFLYASSILACMWTLVNNQSTAVFGYIAVLLYLFILHGAYVYISEGASQRNADSLSECR